MGPKYLNEESQWAAESNRTLRNDYQKNSLSFLGPSKWNKLSKKKKKCNNINTFKHDLKRLYLAQLAN